MGKRSWIGIYQIDQLPPGRDRDCEGDLVDHFRMPRFAEADSLNARGAFRIIGDGGPCFCGRGDLACGPGSCGDSLCLRRLPHSQLVVDHAACLPIRCQSFAFLAADCRMSLERSLLGWCEPFDHLTFLRVDFQAPSARQIRAGAVDDLKGGNLCAETSRCEYEPLRLAPKSRRLITPAAFAFSWLAG